MTTPMPAASRCTAFATVLLLFLAMGASGEGPILPAPAAGFGYPFIMPDDFPSLHGVAWRVEQPEGGAQVLMEPRYPWDVDVHAAGTVLVDPIDGQWKAWYVSAGGVAQGIHNGKFKSRVCTSAGYTRVCVRAGSWVCSHAHLCSIKVPLPQAHAVSLPYSYVQVATAATSRTPSARTV